MTEETAPALQTHVEFVSDEFPACPGEEDQINPGIWGRRLAEYLCAKLPAHGVVTGDPYGEDWGWAIPIGNEAFPMFLGCGNQISDGGNLFLCFIEPSRPFLRRGFFKKIDARPDIRRVAKALHAVLSAHSGISLLRWWDEDEAL